MIANVLVGLVALIHLYIVYLEMVLWNTPRGRKLFKLTPEFASASKVLAASQGLYNGFLAAGLIWGLCLGETGFQIKVFFLLCVASRLPALGRPVPSRRDGRFHRRRFSARWHNLGAVLGNV